MQKGHARDVAAWLVEAGDEAELDRVAAAHEDDRYGRRRRLGRNARWGVGRGDHRHLPVYQISHEIRQSIVLVFRPAILDRHTLTLDVAAFAHALPEGGNQAWKVCRR